MTRRATSLTVASAMVQKAAAVLGLCAWWSSLCLASADAAETDEQKAATTEALAKQAQNPIANLISLPFQNNTTFDYGPRHGTQNILNIQPVLPFTLSEDWNLITRWILPIVHQPSFAKGDSSDTGTGNLKPTLFLSTSLAEDLLVGFGPTFLLPTASSNELGTKKWDMGPSAVFVWTPGHWLVGALANNIWSFAGPDSHQSKVNEFLVQPFVNYNLSEGWYLVSAPIITADWEADQVGRHLDGAGRWGLRQVVSPRPFAADQRPGTGVLARRNAALWRLLDVAHAVAVPVSEVSARERR